MAVRKMDGSRRAFYLRTVVLNVAVVLIVVLGGVFVPSGPSGATAGALWPARPPSRHLEEHRATTRHCAPRKQPAVYGNSSVAW